MYRHYQRLAEPILVNPGSLPTQLDQWYPSSNWKRMDIPRPSRPPAEYPFAVLYNPAAPLTIDQWNPITFRTPRAPAPRPWQSFGPTQLDPSVIVPPSTPAGVPKIFLHMSEVEVIPANMGEQEYAKDDHGEDPKMNEVERIDLEMSE